MDRIIEKHNTQRPEALQPPILLLGDDRVFMVEEWYRGPIPITVCIGGGYASAGHGGRLHDCKSHVVYVQFNSYIICVRCITF